MGEEPEPETRLVRYVGIEIASVALKVLREDTPYLMLAIGWGCKCHGIEIDTVELCLN